MNDHARGCEGREYTCTCGFDEQHYSRIGKRDEVLRECLSWVRHWQADVAGNLKPTPESLAMVEAKIIKALGDVA